MERNGSQITVEELRLFVQVAGYMLACRPDDEGPAVVAAMWQGFEIALQDGLRHDCGHDLMEGLDRCYPTASDRDVAAAVGGVWLMWADIQEHGRR